MATPVVVVAATGPQVSDMPVKIGAPYSVGGVR